MNAPTIAERSLTTCSLACVVAAAEVQPLLERIRLSGRFEVKVLWVLDEPRGGEDADVPAPQVAGALIERAGDANIVLISDRADLMSSEVAFTLGDLATRKGVPIRHVSSFLARPDEVATSDQSDPEAVATLIRVIDSLSGGRRMKRLFDVVLSALGLILALPLMILIALLIRLDSPGHPLLRQERLGQYRRPFQCLKFRTMYEDAERTTGPVWASANDPRITRVGRLLRKSRLDELPQLVNILKGDMAIVGARPVRKYIADQLIALLPMYELRFIEKPGLTGWAQVNLGYPQTIEDELIKFRHEFEYLRRRDACFDLYIVALTVWVVVRMKGL